MIYYYIIFFISLFAAYLFTIPVKNIAPSIGAIDKPNDIKIHSKPISRLDGLGIYVAFLISIFNGLFYYITFYLRLCIYKRILGFYCF